MREIGEYYFQFPLCALAFSPTVKERLEHIISFGFVNAGFAMLAKLSPQTARLRAEEFSTHPETPTDYRKDNSNHVAAMLGAQKIGITPSSLYHSLKAYKSLGDFRFQLEKKHGPDAEVRIAKPLVFEARDNLGISYREFAVLCAVYSAIGAKKYPVRVTRDTIRWRMLGYKSPALMRVEMPNRTDDATPLSLRQINYVLDKLHERGFFGRARANERQTFYSNRLTQEQLENRLMEGKAYSEGFHRRRRERNAALMQRIRDAKAAIKADNSIKVDN